MPDHQGISSNNLIRLGGANFPTGIGVPKAFIQSFKNRLESVEASGDGLRQTDLSGLPNIDLLAGVDPVIPARDQRRRGTCSAFAIVSCLELLIARKKGVHADLSEEFLYWYMRQPPYDEPDVPDYDAGGTRIRQAIGVLQDLGICVETDAPYQWQELFTPPQDRPDQNAIDNAAQIKAKVAEKQWNTDVPPGTAKRVYDLLARELPVAIGIPMFQAEYVAVPNGWTNHETKISGIVVGPDDILEAGRVPEIKAGHAVCVVGFQADEKAHGGGWFVFKNNWNGAFATHPQQLTDEHGKKIAPYIPAKGYGALSAAYVETACWEYVCMDLV